MTVKDKILKWVSEVEKFKRKNPEAKKYQAIIQQTADEIGENYSVIHHETYKSQEEMESRMLKISELSQTRREAENSFKDLMTIQFKDFKEAYENIYDLAISEEGIDRQTLNHVLKVYETYQDKKVGNNQAVNQGIDFMKDKFKLPDDFLTYLPEEGR